MSWTLVLLKLLINIGAIYLLNLLLGAFMDMSPGQILSTGAVLTGIAYLSDTRILPEIGSIYASLLDGFIAMGIVWALQFILPGMSVSLLGALAVGIVVGVFEFFFHPFIVETEKTL